MDVLEETDEFTTRWWLLDPERQYQVLSAYMYALKLTDVETLERIFNLGNPLIVHGTGHGGKPFVRIHQDSVAVMRVMLRAYAK